MQIAAKRPALLMCFLLSCCLGNMLPPTHIQGQETRMSPELLWKLGRLGETTISPEGDRIIYAVRHYALEKNAGTSSLYVVDVRDQSTRNLLENWPGINSIQWSQHDGNEVLYFLGSAPEGSDGATGTQAFRLDVNNGDLTRVTNIDDGIANLKVSPDSSMLAFTRDVKLDPTVTERHPDLPMAEARVIDNLMYRHWSQWHDFKYSHVHVAKFDDNGMAGEAVDLMNGLKVDCPVPPFAGSEHFSWSPESSEICYTAKHGPHWAETTDSDLYLVSIRADGTIAGETVCVTDGMDGYDNEPNYSPDGKYLAFQSMERAGFESDRNRIMLYERSTGAIEELTVGLDQNAGHAHWTPDSASMVFSSEYRGSDQLFAMNVGSPTVKQLTKGQYNWALISIRSPKQLIVTKTSMIRPAEMFSYSLENGSTNALTDINGEIFQSLELPSVEERWVTATDGKRIHCWVIYPPNFDPSKEYPLITYCQGGPQGQIGQWFSYRWNFHLMASAGYVVVAPNRRGLPGFGREWNDQISGDWGGQAMKDILSATDSMLEESYVDRNKAAALGASFGGYTVYWLMGNHQGRFCTMLAHCGVFNLESMYGATEELFFVNWDIGGPYWKSESQQKMYDRFSPHRFVKNWDTPLMVIHGEKDFRVPVTQGMEAFTAAQVNRIRSRFLYFPKEGHWVLQPQNGVVWHREFFHWLDEFCK